MERPVKIKVCGMRSADNIRQVEALGVDMMGFICWEGSSRHVSEVPTYLPSCERVGVFVDAPLSYIQHYADALQLTRIQLHGHEDADFCQQVHEATCLPITKTISVRSKDDILRHEAYARCEAVDLFLFDTKCTCVGGSGEQFDWSVLEHYRGAKPFLLAGGIGPDDAQRVLSFRHPRFAGIDLNSRFELSPALKDVDALRTFIQQTTNQL